jgi:ABC-type antimicrobial peptide transport system permease subunit
MSETFFSINDLLRRRLQTGLVTLGLALCVASTLFLLLLGDKIGFGILAVSGNRLTASFTSVFSSFIVFVGFLVFLVGVVIIAFLAFVMMSQRARDVGLMKAAGCPNDLIFGFFMNELVIVSLAGCLLGVAIGIIGDYASTGFLNSIGFQVSQESINLWVALIIFAIFFMLSLIAGAKPIFDATKIEPAKAMSPSYYYGVRKESDFKGSARAGLAFKMAMRSLFRRKSATLRIIACLTVVFVLVTVAVAGGLIADRTTASWVERAVGKDVVLVAHHDMCSQYSLLLAKFYETQGNTPFNYTDKRYQISDALLNQLSLIQGLSIDLRLVLEANVKEIEGWTIEPGTLSTKPLGDSRQSESLVVGVEPEKVLSDWLLEGGFLENNQSHEAVVGDSLARGILDAPLNQSVEAFGNTFDVIGVCIDSINNGKVTYVPLQTLQNISGVSGPNIVMIKIDASVNRAEALSEINAAVNATSPEFEVLELNSLLDKQTGFLGFIWSTIMLLPVFSLSAAAVCLIGYTILTINEQRQEFGILRAVGAKPRTVVGIVAVQSSLVLLSSYATGVALGIIATLLVLMREPLVTGSTVLEIAGWLLLALVAMFSFSLWPATRFAKKPILEIMTQA